MSVPKHRVAVIVSVLNEAGQLLLVNDHRRGWELPGGLVEQDELVEQAAIREVHEETGIITELTGFRLVAHDVAKNTFIFLLAGKPVEGTLRSSNETSDARYFSIHEALRKMTPKSYSDQIIHCLDSRVAPRLVEYYP